MEWWWWWEGKGSNVLDGETASAKLAEADTDADGLSQALCADWASEPINVAHA